MMVSDVVRFIGHLIEKPLHQIVMVLVLIAIPAVIAHKVIGWIERPISLAVVTTGLTIVALTSLEEGNLLSGLIFFPPCVVACRVVYQKLIN